MIRIIYDTDLNPVSVLDLPSRDDNLKPYVENGLYVMVPVPLKSTAPSRVSPCYWTVFLTVTPLQHKGAEKYLLIVEKSEVLKLNELKPALLETQKLFYEEKK